eukprot:TRINITY_DN2224_c1_g1_i3.p1 TRINITY_DN2224_c1_g1~~TRINITY_DN2224_c1_g1_i3.p1  ORF type:complete len:486 (-),score=163.77 TRINITY_DN2224_c1_g1_i3:462-1919(-)
MSKKEEVEVNVFELVGEELYDVVEWVVDRAEGDATKYIKKPTEEHPNDRFVVSELEISTPEIIGTLFYDAINTTTVDEQLRLVHLLGLLFNNQYEGIKIRVEKALEKENLPLKEMKWGKLYKEVQYETGKRKKCLDAYMNFDELLDESMLLDSDDEDDKAFAQEIPSYAILKKSQPQKKKLGSGKKMFENEMAVDRPHKQGWVYKQGGVNQNWKKRYFVIDNDQVAYYRLTSDIIPAGTFSLLDCFAGRFVESEEVLGFNYVFYVDHPSGRRYMLRGMSDNQVSEWLRVMLMSANVGEDIDDLAAPNQATGVDINTPKANWKRGWDDAGIHLDAKREDSNLLLDMDRLTSSNVTSLYTDPEIELSGSEVTTRRIQLLIQNLSQGKELEAPDFLDEDGKFCATAHKRAPNGFRTWKERFFVVEMGKVTYYEDETMEKEMGSFLLNAGSDFRNVYIPFFPHSFNITTTTSDRMYCFIQCLNRREESG